MIKIGTKQVNKIVINNKEVLKVIQGDGTSTGILKYQAGSTPTPTLGRYVLQGAITGSYTNFSIIDTVTESKIWDGSVSTNIQSRGNGKYRLSYSFIVQAIQNITQQIGKDINSIKITNLYLQPSLQVTMYRRTLRYLKAINYNNNTVFTTTAQGTQAIQSTNVTIAWNDTNIISNYWDLNNTGGIEDISCQNNYATNVSNSYYTQLECYTTNEYSTTSTDLRGVLNLGVLVFFE